MAAASGEGLLDELRACPNERTWLKTPGPNTMMRRTTVSGVGRSAPADELSLSRWLVAAEATVTVEHYTCFQIEASMVSLPSQTDIACERLGPFRCRVRRIRQAELEENEVR